MRAGELEELGGHDHAHGMHAVVVAAALAAAVAVEAGERIEAARLELAAEDVLGHVVIQARSRPTVHGTPLRYARLNRCNRNVRDEARCRPPSSRRRSCSPISRSCSSIASQVLPFGGALLVIAVVPMAAIAARNRLRAVIAGTVAASAVGFLVLGHPGGHVGRGVRCAGRGGRHLRAARATASARTVGVAVVFLWPPVALLTDLLLLVFSAYRELLLAQVHNAWSGMSRVAAQPAHPVRDAIADRGDTLVATLLAPVVGDDPDRCCLIALLIAAVLAQRIAAPTLNRVRAAFAADADALDAR